MDFRGKFDHGVVRPTEPVTLPEGTEVECRPVAGLTESDLVDNVEFWRSRSIEELGREQQAPVGNTAAKLRGDWPSEERIDDFLEYLNKARR